MGSGVMGPFKVLGQRDHSAVLMGITSLCQKVLVFFVIVIFETGSYSVLQAGLKLTM